MQSSKEQQGDIRKPSSEINAEKKCVVEWKKKKKTAMSPRTAWI